MLKVGSSTSLYGLLGVCIGWVIINWPALDPLGPMLKGKVIFTLILIFAFLMLFTDDAVKVDFPPHFGGLLAGIWLSAVLVSL